MFFFCRIALAIPHKDGDIDKCRMYAVNYTQLLESNITESDSSWPTVGCLYGWEYSLTDVPYETISTEVR